MVIFLYISKKLLRFAEIISKPPISINTATQVKRPKKGCGACLLLWKGLGGSRNEVGDVSPPDFLLLLQ